MGFPLSTDIFGQLAWLVRQVKLLVFRVTRIEQGGGGGAQNIDQVLTTGNTATNKSLINTVSSFGITYTSTLTPYSLNVNENSGGSVLYATYGRSQILFYNSVDASALGIGRNEGYLGGLGFTIANGVGSSVSCDPTQYVITSSTVRNDITADSITITDVTNSSLSLGFKFDLIGVNGSGPILKSTINGYDVGLYFYNRSYTIGEEGLSGGTYFGIDTLNNRLIGSASLRDATTVYSNPNGFVQIFIDGQQFWIELWTA